MVKMRTKEWSHILTKDLVRYMQKNELYAYSYHLFLLKTGLDKKVGRASVVAVKRMPCKNVAMNFISKHNDTIPPNR